jgi:acyl-CoA thioesterase FadM
LVREIQIRRLSVQDFQFTLPYVVRIADINYGGHLANSAVLNIFQDARIGYLAEVGPYSELDLGGCGIILPEAHIQFRAEMFLRENLQVGVRCTRIGRSSFQLEYRIERGGELTAEGETPVICFDYQKRKPVRLPAAFREALAAFENL